VLNHSSFVIDFIIDIRRPIGKKKEARPPAEQVAWRLPENVSAHSLFAARLLLCGV
jgi:hypothetical protein